MRCLKGTRKQTQTKQNKKYTWFLDVTFLIVKLGKVRKVAKIWKSGTVTLLLIRLCNDMVARIVDARYMTSICAGINTGTCMRQESQSQSHLIAGLVR